METMEKEMKETNTQMEGEKTVEEILEDLGKKQAKTKADRKMQRDFSKRLFRNFVGSRRMDRLKRKNKSKK